MCGLVNPASALSELINGIVSATSAPDDSLVVDLYDADTGVTTRVATVQSDPAEARSTFVNGYRIAFWQRGSLSILFNVSSNDPQVAGIQLTTSPIDDGNPTTFAPLNRVAAQAADVEFTRFGFHLLDGVAPGDEEVGLVLEITERSFSDGIQRPRLSIGPAEVDGVDVELIPIDLGSIDPAFAGTGGFVVEF